MKTIPNHNIMKKIITISAFAAAAVAFAQEPRPMGPQGPKPAPCGHVGQPAKPAPHNARPGKPAPHNARPGKPAPKRVIATESGVRHEWSKPAPKPGNPGRPMPGPGPRR